MNLMCQIEVEDLRFYSFHGFYKEEQVLGNEYLVSIKVTLPLQSHLNEDINNTINYENLYNIAKTEMAIPRKLLETVAQSILVQTKEQCHNAFSIKVKICKINPSFGGDQAKSTIILTWGNNPSENET